MRAILWSIALLYGASQTWIYRQGTNPDAISYLDIGDAYFWGDWSNAVSAYWAPLYSWLLGGVLRVLKPPAAWEFPAAHLVNFLIYLVAVLCFDSFLRELVLTQRSSSTPTSDSSSLPEWAWWSIGYAVFLWSSFALISPELLVPDLCVAALVYWASATLLRISTHERPGLFACLGFVLGIGYLAKAPMFPLAFVFIAASALALGDFRKALARVPLALACFFLVAAPCVLVFSLNKGRITFGESGRLNYAWEVNGVPSRHWQGGNSADGVPQHPTRKIFEAPATYEFSRPIRATYPLWFDISYWYDGISVHVIPRNQIKAIGEHVKDYTALFALHGSPLLVGLIGCLYLTVGKGYRRTGAARERVLLIPAFAALAMYSLVHVETRYVAPFVVIILLVLLSEADVAARRTKRRAIVILASSALLLAVTPALVRQSLVSVRDLVFRDHDPGRDGFWRIAEELRKRGLHEGDRVASVGYANAFNARWARLARVSIVAEIYDDRDVAFFWTADPSVRRGVLSAFAKSGVTLVAARGPLPRLAFREGWEHIVRSDAYVLFLTQDRKVPEGPSRVLDYTK